MHANEGLLNENCKIPAGGCRRQPAATAGRVNSNYKNRNIFITSQMRNLFPLVL